MAESYETLMAEFLTWFASRRRTYNEAMEAWQSHCPRQTLWEDAIIAGHVELKKEDYIADPEVVLTDRGIVYLSQIVGR